MDNNVFNLNEYRKKKIEEKSPKLIPPPETFEINKLYEFNPAVKSIAFYDKELTKGNEIGTKLFIQGKCLEYLGNTVAGPRFLFSGKLINEANTTLNDVDVYFGVIYNTTDPERSHAK